MPVPRWPRRHPPQSERRHGLLLMVFSAEEPPPSPLRAERVGLPEGALAALEVRRHDRADDPTWFDRWRQGPLRALAERDLDTLAPLDAATLCHSIRYLGPDAADLGGVQAAWAVARWLGERGATVVLDTAAGRAFDAARLPPPRPHLRVQDHVTLVIETEPCLGGDGFLMHTRGLGSFARPDLALVAAADEMDAAAPVLWNLAAALADGWMPTPGVEVAVTEELVLALHPDPGLPWIAARGIAPEVWLLTDLEGAAPVGAFRATSSRPTGG